MFSLNTNTYWNSAIVAFFAQCCSYITITIIKRFLYQIHGGQILGNVGSYSRHQNIKKSNISQVVFSNIILFVQVWLFTSVN